MKIRQGIAGLASAAFLLGAVACGDTDSSGAADGGAQEDEVTYFKYADNPSFDLVYLADELGYWDEANVRPEYVGAVDANQLIPLTGTGELDFSTRMASLPIAAIHSGADVEIVAASNQTLPDAPHMNYFVREDSGITADNLEALEGKTIALNGFGACAEFVTKQYLEDQGVDVDSINWVPTPDTQSEQAVEQGSADMAIIHAPHSGRALNNPELESLFSDHDLDGGVSGSQPYTGHGEFIRENPEATEEFVEVIAKTQSWVNQNPDEARQVIGDRIGMDVEDVTRYAYINNAIIDREQIQYWIDTLESYGQLPEDHGLTAEDVATNRYNPYIDGDELIDTQAENTTDLVSDEA